MDQRMENCPSCNGPRRMGLSLGWVPTSSTEASEFSLLYHFHCTSCNAYVRTRTMEFEDFILPPIVPEILLSAYI